MKIAYIIPYIAQSGPVNVVKYLCEVLMKEHDVNVFYLKNIPPLDFPVRPIKITFLEKVDFDQYDIIHSHGVLPDAYVWFHRKSIKKAKTVTTLHNYVKEDYKYAYNPVKAFLLERVWNRVTSKHDSVVTLSRDAVKYYSKFWKNKHLTFVYNGIPISQMPIKKHEHNTYRKIGLVGSGDITARKGFDQVIMALKGLDQYSLYIAGKGQQIEKLQYLAEKEGVSDRVHFLGFQKNIDLFIESMDLCILPSRSEGCPLVLLEFARAGKAVVCSRIPILEELFTSKEVSFFVLDNIQELELKIEQTYLARKILSKNIQEHFFACYTSEVMSENYMKQYRNMIQNDSK